VSRSLRLTLRNDAAALPAAQAGVDRLLGDHEISDSTASTVRLVLEELLTNIIKYAYPQGGTHEIELSLDVSSEEVQLSLRDDGREFDPTSQVEPELPSTLDEAEPGGRGLVLVRAFSKAIDYSREQGRNRIKVRISREP